MTFEHAISEIRKSDICNVCIYAYMVKVISIQDDVYEALSKRKDDRSFSEVIRELINESKKGTTFGDLIVYLDTLPSSEAKVMKEETLAGRKRARPRNIKEF